MAHYPPVFILRHGQTEWNLAQRLQGSLDSALTELGRVQAAAQGRLLQDVFARYEAVVFVSPLGRTRQTADIALEGHNRNPSPIFDARIAEINAGDWEGLERCEIARRWPEAAKASSDFEYYTNASNGEGEANLRKRCHSFLAELRGPSVLITHGICSVMLRGLLCDLDHQQMVSLPLTQGCIFEIRDQKEVILKEAK